MLLPAIILITAALVFYSIGIWAERIQRVLKWWHAGFFALGLLCDASGTYLMTQLAASGEGRAEGAGAGLNAVMAVTGAAALLLMVIHLAWAAIVLLRNRDAEKKQFHKFSLLVWGIWLIPYFTGAIGTNLG
ncbi:HsmA family protein [Arthrobacter sp. HMWF013]|uniref:HsmA family protein n=1 Tax=Arthrobacter sp. HMWF013 TaxID=2056849 RepID=UPI000D3D2C4E|nr:HsmA family protein [Arthrobacter sp. HMWF013]PTT61633.1 TIGR03987 family protein [Arthrobacter sp. HMWF013]